VRWLIDLLPPMCIVLGLSVTLAFQTAALAPLHADNERAFHSFSNGIEEYRDFKVAWRTRLLANFGAAEVARWNDRFAQQRNDEASALEWTIASWTVLWFALLGLMYVHAAGRRSIFYLFGAFSALLFGYTPSVERIYPWDLPIVVIFTAFLILYVRKKYWLIAAVLPLGMGFKETSAVLCLAFFFTEQSWTRRLVLLTVSLSACLAVKTAIDIYVDVPIPFFTMEYAREGGEDPTRLHLLRNLRSLLNLDLVPVLANGGTLLAFMLLPSLNRTVKGLKLVSLAFLAGIFLFANIGEFRIFFETIPFALYALELFSYGDSCLDRSADQYETT
jgi:hypothetical protein